MKKNKAIKLTGPSASMEAYNKARYGRKDWIVYTDRSGERIAELLTAESLKRAMLEKGTQGTFTHIVAGGHRMLMRWRIAVNLFIQLRSNHAI